MAHSIRCAIAAGIFEDIVVSTDSEEYAEVARRYGASVPFLRPVEMAGPTSPDIEWIRYTLQNLEQSGSRYDCFSILRPTSPFRRAESVRKAFEQFVSDGAAHSLRAVEKCTEHPAKQWRINGTRMRPVMENPDRNATPWHSSPYQSLPEVFVQNASLEIAWTRTALELGSIAGSEIMPFITPGYEGFDINNEEDWIVAESLLERGLVTIPT